MGEIADMMLDGTLDCETGEYIGDHNKELFGTESPGFPVRVRDWKTEKMKNYRNKSGYNFGIRVALESPSTKIHCPLCGKRVKAIGLKDHLRSVHGV